MWGNSNSARLRRVVPIRSFEDAQKRYESIKPIRGRADETIRPLSDRGAVDTYSIRKKTHEGKVCYECWMYQTPVITYNENGTIVFDMGSWPSASTRTFISEVSGFPCGVKAGVSYVHVPDIGNVVMPDRGPTAVQFINGKWELVLSKPVFEVQMQHEAATAVRTRYKEFIDYVDNMLKLRVEQDKWGGMVEIITFTGQEFEDQLKDTLVWFKDWTCITKPLLASTNYSRSMAKDFLSLVSSDQPESIKANNFYSAFLLLIAVRKGYHNMSQIQKDVRHPTQCFELRQKLKEVLYRCNSDEVFRIVELPVGRIPNKRYAGWV